VANCTVLYCTAPALPPTVTHMLSFIRSSQPGGSISTGRRAEERARTGTVSCVRTVFTSPGPC
jgi:hypothetical protein